MTLILTAGLEVTLCDADIDTAGLEVTVCDADIDTAGLEVTVCDADIDTAGLEVTPHCALTRARRTSLVGGNSGWRMFVSYFLGISPDIVSDFYHKFVTGYI